MSERHILSIKDLNKYIKMRLEGDSGLQDVWVRGEISNFTHHSSGHMYFTLKDKDSRLKSIMFASYNQRLPFLPREGTNVLARGSISVYERDGQYQFYITQMQPDGIGSLYLAFEQLKKKLEDEGLFSPSRKKPIPSMPRAIGVITSPTGAAVRDIVITLQRRFPNASILLYPVLVQGKQAAPSIVKALADMNHMAEVDVLIVGRGGGSLEELWAFNEESVARAIAASIIPIISAVGHETDFTIADFVADLRAATPTAAAELAVPSMIELKQQMAGLSLRLRGSLRSLLQRKTQLLQELRRSPYLVNPRRQLLTQPADRLDRLREQLQFRARRKLAHSNDRQRRAESALRAHSPSEQLQLAKQRIDAYAHRIRTSALSAYNAKRQTWMSQLRHLDAVSPLHVMRRGYSLVYDEREEKLVSSVSQVQLGDVVKVQMTDGRLTCHVWSMEEREHDKGQSGT
jgi:exodeoxyribonuclease VII large subunit